jgi:AcrR family transcriptional regulator
MSSEYINKGIEARIIEAAKLIFQQKGYDATTMGDIAAEVGISRTAMHYYFRTKEIMFGAIFTQLIERITPNIEALMNDNSIFLEKLPKLIDIYIMILTTNPLLPLFVITEMNREPQRLFNEYSKNYKLTEPMMKLLSQINNEMECGLIKKMPLIDVISTFIGLNLFPLLAKNALKEIFMNGDDKAFDEYILNRKQLIYNIMYNLLSPNLK